MFTLKVLKVFTVYACFSALARLYLGEVRVERRQTFLEKRHFGFESVL